MMSILERLLESPTVYSAWQMPFVSQKFAPVAKYLHGQMVRRVLDIGCGPGTNAAQFAHADYVGVDINERYLAAARSRHRGRFIQADLATTDITALGRFDTVLVNSFLHHLADDAVARILAQAAALLDAEGRVPYSRTRSPEGGLGQPSHGQTRSGTLRSTTHILAPDVHGSFRSRRIRGLPLGLWTLGDGVLSRKTAVMRLSVGIPVFNEQEVIPELLTRVMAVLDKVPGGPHEVVFVDDGSGPAPRVRSVTWNNSTQLTANVEIRSGGPRRDRHWDVQVANPDGSSGAGVGLLTITP